MAPMPSLASFVPARFHAHCTVAGGFLLHLTLGTLYSIGNLNPYWASYMRAVHCGEAYDTCESAGGVTNTEMVWVLNAATATQACTMFVGGGLQHRIGPRQTALLLLRRAALRAQERKPPAAAAAVAAALRRPPLARLRRR